jgi:hypothetical protein
VTAFEISNRCSQGRDKRPRLSQSKQYLPQESNKQSTKPPVILQPIHLIAILGDVTRPKTPLAGRTAEQTQTRGMRAFSSTALLALLLAGAFQA